MMHNTNRNGAGSVKPEANAFDRYPYMKHSTADKTLADYIGRLDSDRKFPGKLTFDEWYASVEPETYDKTEYACMKMAWNAAKENV